MSILDLDEAPAVEEDTPALVYLSDLDLRDEWTGFLERSPVVDLWHRWATSCTCANCARTRFVDWLAESRLEDPSGADEVQWCADCYEGYPDIRENMSLISTGEYVCDACRNDYRCCARCEELVSDTTTTLSGAEVCNDCRECAYSFCEDCNGYYPDGDGCGREHSESCQCEAPGQHFCIRNDGEEALWNDKLVTVGLPAGHISTEGLDQIRALLLNKAHTFYDWTDGTFLDRGAYVAWTLLSGSMPKLGDAWQMKGGNYTKRLSHLAYTECNGLKVPPEILSEVGNIARASSTGADCRVQVTRDLNLPPEDFANEDSCWWQSYAYSRCALKSSGGFGLRSFDEQGEVAGRAWVMPLKLTHPNTIPSGANGTLTPTFETLEPAAFVVFNGYGDMSGYVPARLLSHMAGMTYRKIAFTCAPMYINGDVGYLVAPEEIARNYTDGALYLSVDEHSDLYNSELERKVTTSAA